LAVIGHRRLPHGPRTAQAASSAAEDSASILRVPVMQDRRPGQCSLPDVAGDLRIQFAETGQDGQAAQTQNARSQPQSNRAHLSQAPPLVLLKPSHRILVARIDKHHSGRVTVAPDHGHAFVTDGIVPTCDIRLTC
jgi:hypothetical protein